MNGQIHSMQESIARLESSHAEIGEQQKMLKQKVLLQELTVPTSFQLLYTSAMLPLFVPSEATTVVAPRHGTGRWRFYRH